MLILNWLIQYVSNNHTIADFKFTNQNVKIVTQKDYEGKIYIADLFFTTCIKICPKMTENIWFSYKFTH